MSCTAHVATLAMLALVGTACDRSPNTAAKGEGGVVQPPEPHDPAPTVRAPSDTQRLPNAATETAPALTWHGTTATFATSAGQVSVELPGGPTRVDAAEAVARVFAQVDRRVGLKRSGAELLRIEKAAPNWVQVPDDVWWLLLQVNKATARFGHGAAVTKGSVELDSAPPRARLTVAGTRLQVATAARGYALQLASEKLRMLGVSRFVAKVGSQWATGLEQSAPEWRSTSALTACAKVPQALQYRLRAGATAVWCKTDPSSPKHRRDSAPPPATAVVAVWHASPIKAGLLAAALAHHGTGPGMKALAEIDGADAAWVTEDGKALLSAGIRDDAQLQRRGKHP